MAHLISKGNPSKEAEQRRHWVLGFRETPAKGKRAPLGVWASLRFHFNALDATPNKFDPPKHPPRNFAVSFSYAQKQTRITQGKVNHIGTAKKPPCWSPRVVKNNKHRTRPFGIVTSCVFLRPSPPKKNNNIRALRMCVNLVSASHEHFAERASALSGPGI